MSLLFVRLQNYAIYMIQWVKQFFVKKFIWKYVGVFGVGGVAGLILSFNYAKNITNSTTLQLTSQIMTQSGISKFSDTKYNNPSEWKKIIPTASVRPSPQLLNLIESNKDIFTINPKWTPREHFDHSQKLFAQIVPFMKLYPSYVPNPIQFKHVINKQTNINGLELRYPGCNISNGVLLYYHGGGLFVGRWDFALTVLYPLCKQTGMIGISLDYRLANGSEVTLPDQVNDGIDGYNYIMNTLNVSSDKIYILGESGGATLTLLTLLEIRNRNIKQPKGVVSMSPICDLTLDSKSCQENEKYDIVKKNAFTKPMQVVVGNMDMNGNIINNNDMKSAKFSCKYANWDGITSHVYMQSSKWEMLRDDIRETVKNAKNANVNVVYEENNICPHGVASWAHYTPESTEAMTRVSQWINNRKK